MRSERSTITIPQNLMQGPFAERLKKAGVPHWFPYQLRHTAATRIRRQYGLEAAQVILGHASIEASQIYAERDLTRAMEIAESDG